MNIPNGAEKVIAARKKGFKPSEMLIISLVGKLQELNHTIYANPDAVYDWRWMVGLKACIFTKTGIDSKAILKAVAKSNPDWLGMYDLDQFKGADVSFLPLAGDIEKPQSQWRYKLQFLVWTKWQNEEFSWN